MYHSITFGDMNTWDDWRLVPSSRPLFNPPAQKTKTLDIPGGDGVIDLSTSLTGYPVYQNRTGSIEFYVMNDFKEWHVAYSDIMDYLHGKAMRAILEDDPDYFYEGRFSVNAWKSEKDWSKIVIDYNVGPYKWSVLSSRYWDSTNFSLELVDSLRDSSNNRIYDSVNDIIIGRRIFDVTAMQDIDVTSTETEVKLDGYLLGRAPVCPEFIVTGAAVNVRFVNPTLNLDLTATLPVGTSQQSAFIFYGDPGATLYFSCAQGSTATVTIDFRQGRL